MSEPGVTIVPSHERGVFYVKSRSEPNLWHVVTDGICDCLGYQHRHHCWHLDELMRRGHITAADIDRYTEAARDGIHDGN